jgi:hypothetical protein
MRFLKLRTLALTRVQVVRQPSHDFRSDRLIDYFESTDPHRSDLRISSERDRHNIGSNASSGGTEKRGTTGTTLRLDVHDGWIFAYACGQKVPCMSAPIEMLPRAGREAAT